MGTLPRRVRAILSKGSEDQVAGCGCSVPHRRVPSATKYYAAIAVCLFAMLDSSGALANSFVRLDYNLFTSRARGTVFIELFDDRPITRDNFLAYVNSGKYDQTLMHRIVHGFVLQGGGFSGDPSVKISAPAPVYSYLLPIEVDLDGNSQTDNPMIQNEFNNSPARSNVKGTLAMAKLPGNPNSATSEFFFNLANNAGTCPNGLDCQNGGFTVFAGVVGDGMSFIDALTFFDDPDDNPNTNNNVYQLPPLNLNPDLNNNGVREGGPFGSVPVLSSSTPVPVGNPQNYAPLVLLDADQIDYLGAGLQTTIPSGGLTFSTRDTFIDTGTTFTTNGAGPHTLTVAAGRTLGVREGTVLASRSLYNLGTLEPGLRIGSVTLQSFRQDPGAHLEIEINGTTADTQYDRIVATGGAILGGDLDVTTFGYNPVAGNSFTILAAGLITGSFNNINLPELSPGLVWAVNQTNTALTLTVNSGDFNQDGVVDAADYVYWRKTNTPSNGYTIWTQNFGNTSGGDGGGGSAAITGVPEPTTAMLLCTAIPFVFSRRGRSRSVRPKTA